MYKTCLEIGRAVSAMGAGTVVFANGHGGNTALLQVVLREIRKQYGLRTFAMPTLSMNRTPPNGEGLDEHGLGIHGGAAETSLLMHLRPDLVDLSLAQRWVPEHLADFELIGFNARPVSFLAVERLRHARCGGRPDAGDHGVRRRALRRVDHAGGRVARGDRALHAPRAGRAMNLEARSAVTSRPMPRSPIRWRCSIAGSRGRSGR